MTYSATALVLLPGRLATATPRAVAAGMAKHLGEPVSFTDLPFEVYRNLGFPGADDLSNMFQVQSIFIKEFLANRDVKLARALHPGLQNFDTWLSQNIRKIPLG